MNIVIIGPAHPYRGGIAMFNERLAKAFQERNHQIEIITYTLQYPSFLFPGKTQFSDDPAPKGTTINKKINSINPISWIKVGFLLKKKQPDLVIFSYWMPFMAPCFGVISSILRKNKTTKTIGLIHNIIPHEKRIGDRLLSKFFTKRMNGFITMSENVMKDLINFTSKPTLLTPHPLYDNFGERISKEEARRVLNLKETEKYLLFFGIIRKYKGLDILLNALNTPQLKALNINLIIAGEFYDDETEYLNLIKQNNLENRVLITKSFIPNNEVANYFCASDFVVQPYKHATQSGVTQIAYHFNKPMLVTDVGGLKEMVPNNIVGYVTQPDSEDVANAIEDFYENNRENEFINGIEQEKRKYSWNNMVDKFTDLYQKI